MKPSDIVMGSLFVAAFLFGNIMIFGPYSGDKFYFVYFGFVLIFSAAAAYTIKGNFVRSDAAMIMVLLILLALSATYFASALRMLDYSGPAGLKGMIANNEYLANYNEYQLAQISSYQNESKGIISNIDSSSAKAVASRDAEIARLKDALEESNKLILEYKDALAEARATPVIRRYEDD